MRRKDREVTDIDKLLEIVSECKVCRVAAQDEQGLYIIPLNFGYEYKNDKLTLYIHSAKQGRKVDAFRKNNRIAFEMDCGHRLIENTDACEYGYAFRSILGNGIISVIEDVNEKTAGLSLLMKHQTGKDFIFDERIADTVLVYKVDVTSFTGKQKL